MAATLTAVAPSPTRIAHSPPATATATPEPEPATISGRICFPSESIPPMDLYIEDLDHATAVEMRIARDQSSYSVDVPAGHYLAYAWLPDFSLYGGYTHAVPCGLSVECTDHRLVELSLDAGEKRADVDICDWYAPQSDWHHPPS